MHGMRIINPDAFHKALNQMHAGKIAFVSAENFEIPYTATEPIDGYLEAPNFPNCCETHKQIYAYAKDVYQNFPNCCETHKKLLTAEWFNKENYKGIPEKIVKTFAYTQHHISKQIDLPEWYKDIANYLEYSFASFGQFPNGYGIPFGWELYFINVKFLIENSDKIAPEKKQKLLEFLDDYAMAGNKKAESSDLNLLIDTHNRWLKIFPFRISYFGNLKEFLENDIPILQGTPEYNPYTRTTKTKTVTQSGLIKTLTERTKLILQTVVTSEVLDKGVITDIHKHAIELRNERHRIKQSSLLEDFTKGEMRYVTVLKKWLTNEKEYFKELIEDIEAKGKKEQEKPTKLEKLKADITIYGFFDLPKVKVLSESMKGELIELISTNKLPYQIAMFDFLGFIAHLEKAHFTAKYRLYKELSKWLDADKEGRAVKGNINSLNSKSNDSKSRYTAYQHKETVKNDYQKLK